MLFSHVKREKLSHREGNAWFKITQLVCGAVGYFSRVQTQRNSMNTVDAVSCTYLNSSSRNLSKLLLKALAYGLVMNCIYGEPVKYVVS